MWYCIKFLSVKKDIGNWKHKDYLLLQWMRTLPPSRTKPFSSLTWFSMRYQFRFICSFSQSLWWSESVAIYVKRLLTNFVQCISSSFLYIFRIRNQRVFHFKDRHNPFEVKLAKIHTFLTTRTASINPLINDLSHYVAFTSNHPTHVCSGSHCQSL